jgi:hypothetical protein
MPRFNFKLPTKATYFKSDKLSSTEMFHELIKATNFLGKLVGCPIFSPDFTIVNPIFFVLVVDIVIYLAVSFQNIYAFREDFERQIFCVVTLGMGFQGIVKLYTFVFRRPNILKLMEIAEEFHKASSDKKIFERRMMISAHVGSFFGFVFMGADLLVFIYPAIYYAIVGTKILHFGFIFPGIDWTTPLGYSLNFMFHTYQLYAVITGIYISSFLTVFLMLNAFGQFETLELEIENLGELAKRNRKNRNDEKISNLMKTITDEHVKLLE